MVQVIEFVDPPVVRRAEQLAKFAEGLDVAGFCLQFSEERQYQRAHASDVRSVLSADAGDALCVRLDDLALGRSVWAGNRTGNRTSVNQIIGLRLDLGGQIPSPPVTIGALLDGYVTDAMCRCHFTEG